MQSYAKDIAHESKDTVDVKRLDRKGHCKSELPYRGSSIKTYQCDLFYILDRMVVHDVIFSPNELN